MDTSFPASIRNWKAKILGHPRIGAAEYRLHSDSDFLDHFVKEDWPYKFINAIPRYTEQGFVKPSIFLRLNLYVSLTRNDLSASDTKTYHGGDIIDEIAALVSLVLGARVESGGMSRDFSLEGDPLGRPIEFDSRAYRSIRAASSRPFVLPDVVASVNSINLNRLEILASLPELDAISAIALVKASRLYQEALWIAEEAPELAWLLLVSALEVAANCWRTAQDSPSARLAASKPELAEILTGAGGEAHLKKVAEIIEPTLGATKKFIDFTMQFLDTESRHKPLKFYHVDWCNSAMKRILSRIYEYRSKALHDGSPFPAPMCWPPHHFGEDRAFAETVLGLAASSKGSVWLKEDLPMNLHGFHLICRNALMNWWESLSSRTQSAEL